MPESGHLLVLRLVASRYGKEAASTRWIEVLPPSFANDVGFPAAPAEGGVVARGHKNAARWGNRFEVATVASVDGRKLEVRHDGRRAALPASGEASSALAGTALEGDWELWWQADGGEAPDTLTVHVVARCRKGKQ